MNRLPSKATHQQTRQYNYRLVLRTVHEFGTISRAEVARVTQLTRTTVSDVVTELLANGLVEEVGRGPSSGGKAPILLHVVKDARHVIGLDLGDGTFNGALVNLRGEVGRVIRVPVDGRDGDAAVSLVYGLLDELMEASAGTLLGIGVGTPGVIDTRSGTIRWAVNLDWQDLPLGRLLADRYGLPVNVVNDSQAAAMAEFAFGGGGSGGSNSGGGERGTNLVVIKVGRGVGAGIVLDGRLFQGDGFGAGEIGHIAVVDDGAACRCGGFGCLETVASSPAIVARARELAGEIPGSSDGMVSLEDVGAAFREGDEAARTAVLEAGRYLGRAIASIVGALDVHRIVLLGSATTFGQPWLDAVRDEARRRTLALLSKDTEIEIASLRSDVVVLGSSALLMTNELGLGLAR